MVGGFTLLEEKRFTHQTSTHSETRTHVRAGTHTNYTNYKITTGQLSATGPCYGKSSGCCLCVCVCVCAVEPLGSQSPCRALGVLIRQTQPSRVHHRENRGEREVEPRMKWWVYVGEAAKQCLSPVKSSGGREKEWKKEGISWKKDKKLKYIIYSVVPSHRELIIQFVQFCQTLCMCEYLCVCEWICLCGLRYTEEHHRCRNYDKLHSSSSCFCLCFEFICVLQHLSHLPALLGNTTLPSLHVSP